MKRFEELSFETLDFMLLQLQDTNLKCAVAEKEADLCGGGKRLVAGRDASGENLLILCQECGSVFEQQTGCRVFPVQRTIDRIKGAMGNKEVEEGRRRREKEIREAKQKEALEMERKRQGLLARKKAVLANLINGQTQPQARSAASAK
jgi:hypothetical protein